MSGTKRSGLGFLSEAPIKILVLNFVLSQHYGKTFGFSKVKIVAGNIPFLNMEKIHEQEIVKLLGN
jgi:hypothetical protein